MTNVYQKFEAHYKQFAEGILRYVYFKVSDYEIAQDITSDVFVRYWKVLSGDKKIDNHKAFLYVIAKGVIVDYYRKKIHKTYIPLDNIDERLLGTIDPIEQNISVRQDLEQIYTKIKKLRRGFQEVLFLHYVEDLTIKEIASIRKKKENAIRVILHRALHALKESL